MVFELLSSVEAGGWRIGGVGADGPKDGLGIIELFSP
jgi:hypothetical protein